MYPLVQCSILMKSTKSAVSQFTHFTYQRRLDVLVRYVYYRSSIYNNGLGVVSKSSDCLRTMGIHDVAYKTFLVLA